MDLGRADPGVAQYDGPVGSSLIHLLLAVVLVVIIVRLVQGRSV